MKKLFSFALVLAMVLMTPLSTFADTAEVTAIRYGDEEERENPNTTDLSNISTYMIMLVTSGSLLVVTTGRRKRHEIE